MGFLDYKPPKQVELERKIKSLRDAGMVSSAERLELQLKCLANTSGEKIVPMKPQELARHAKAQKAMGVKA